MDDSSRHPGEINSAGVPTVDQGGALRAVSAECLLGL